MHPLRMRSSWQLPLLIGALAFAVRRGSVANVGGLQTLLGYDEGVYMGAATALVHGLMPYRDFTLVHPPGSTVLLAPFAELGRLTSEPAAWAAARICMMLLGGVSAALITVVARRVSIVAALGAGLLYALWGPVVHVERTTMLEGFVLSGIVMALVALRRPNETIARAVLAGAALGLGMSVKLWGAAPLAVILLWLLISRAWRTLAIVAGAAASAFTLVVAPFMWAAGWRMVQLVFLAQMARGQGGTPLVDRPARILSMDGTLGAHDVSGVSPLPSAAVWAGVGVIALSAIVVAWRRPIGRLWVALLIVQVAVLLAVPVYFAGYSSFVGPALALVLGAGLDVAVRDPRPPALRRPVAFMATVVVVLMAATGISHVLNDGDSLRAADDRVAAVVDASRCVAADSSGVLLLYDALGRSIDDRCGRPLIDVDGTVYAVQPDNPGRLSSSTRRTQSDAYQQALRSYFGSGDTVLIHRAGADALTEGTSEVLAAKGLTLELPGLHVFGGPGGAAASDGPRAGMMIR
ncbi:MAG: DUF2029 domain-containing protein [Actinomycetales bacterium]|nr:DUF2029 domain-containing protein [Actinomycetales bacterium]